MKRLEQQQRGLLELIKARRTPRPDSSLQHLACSSGLAMVREIALWWRAFQLEAQCPFSSRLLKRLGRFDEAVAAYFNNNATSPFVEELSVDFLTWLAADENPLVRTLSLFERALLEVRSGSPENFEIVWDRHPDTVFQAITDGREMPAREADRLYRMRVSRDVPQFVSCTVEESG